MFEQLRSDLKVCTLFEAAFVSPVAAADQTEDVKGKVHSSRGT